MKAFHVWCLASLVFVLSMPAFACSPEKDTIEVTGKSHVVLEPDYAEWVVDIVVEDKNPAVAIEAEKKAVESLRKIMKDADIDKPDIHVGRPKLMQETTERRRLGESYEYIGTTVYRRVTFNMRDLDELPDVLVAIHKLGVKYRYAYKSSKYEATLEQAKLDALKDAKAIAVRHAAALGQKIGPAVYVGVSEGDADHYSGGLFGSDLTVALPQYGDDEAYDSSAAGPDGRVHVRAYAHVDFEIKP